MPVFGIGKSTLYGYGKGTVHLQSLPDPHTTSIHLLPDVWYVPKLSESIISKYWMKQHGLITTLDEDENIIITSTTRGSTFKAKSQYINRITVFPTVTYLPNSASVHAISNFNTIPKTFIDDSPTSYAQLMHERLGHISAGPLHKLGINYMTDNCNHCILGKQTCTPFCTLTEEEKPKQKLTRVHIDHCGTITPISIGGNQYIVRITDSYTDYSWGYVVPDKSADTLLHILTKWKAMVENQSGMTLQTIFSDNAKE